MGHEDGIVQDTRVSRGQGSPGRAWSTGRTVLDDPDGVSVIEAGRVRTETAGQLCTPVLRDGLVSAVVCASNRLDGRGFNEHDQLLLEAIADRLGHILDRVESQQRTQRDFQELGQSLRKGVAIRRARHDELAEIAHGICIETGRALQLSNTELTNLTFALQSYDLGLTGIPDEILYKGQPLEPEEWEIIQQHVHISLRMLSSLDAPGEVHDIVLHHHEHYDGTGYPEGLSGEDIPLGARLLGLADSLTAMLQGRPYKRAMSLDQALSEMETRSAGHYCPRCLAVFVEEARKQADRINDIQQTRNLAVGGAAAPVATADEPVLVLN